MLEDAVIEVGADVGAGDGMGLAGVELEVVGDAGFDQLLQELDGVFHVDVVVAGAVDQ